ncbi:hypothetical protein J3Q64DRAFT_1776555 [Phycomyces blakesleeanus]|uniref:Uncharacterized protein n=1 Tax=Phycomyces blakesleeanus TaxID=4837 RepID=A0ABR3AJN8_PHYBL
MPAKRSSPTRKCRDPKTGNCINSLFITFFFPLLNSVFYCIVLQKTYKPGVKSSCVFSRHSIFVLSLSLYMSLLTSLIS